MLKKLAAVFVIMLGAAAGVGAGLALQPIADPVPPAEAANPCGDDPNAATVDGDAAARASPAPVRSKDDAYEYVKLSNQFIVPIVRGEIVTAVAVVALSLEVETGAKDAVYAVEPRLRDRFLQTLFDHASVGGFDGAFATAENLIRMRRALKEAAVGVMGHTINDVLITDIARQDN